MEKERVIPEEIQEIMSYLAHTFAKSLNDPVNSEDDLFNDMVILYLENVDGGKVSDPKNKNHWYQFFKSQMINKYKRVMHGRKILNLLKTYGS